MLSDPQAQREGPFRILFVCTGNVCRSAFAQVLTEHLLTGRLGAAGASRFSVTSAGTRAMHGSAMHPATRKQLAGWPAADATAARFTARQLEVRMVAEADLVLGITREHRSAVVTMSPQALPVAFSLLEFARLAAAVDPPQLPDEPVERAHVLTGNVRARRGMTAPAPPGSETIPDPIGRGASAHRASAALVRAAVTAMVEVIAPPRPGQWQ